MNGRKIMEEAARNDRAWALATTKQSGGWETARWEHDGIRYAFHRELPKGGELPNGERATRWHTYDECLRLKDATPRLWDCEILPAVDLKLPVKPRAFIAGEGGEMFSMSACPICGREGRETDGFGQCADTSDCDLEFGRITALNDKNKKERT